jgi:hypothetical protein
MFGFGFDVLMKLEQDFRGLLRVISGISLDIVHVVMTLVRVLVVFVFMSEFGRILWDYLF